MHRFRATIAATTAVLALFAAGCSQTGGWTEAGGGVPAMPSGYTCCNFHHEGDWINDGNYAQLPFIPLGSPIRVKDYGRYRAQVEIDGKPFRLGLDYGRTAETTEQWVRNKMIVQEDPKLKLAQFPVPVQEAIRAGKVMVGMTKEQVIMSIGHPMTSENPNPEATTWYYWWSSFDRYDVQWDSRGRVKDVVAHPETVQRILASGTASAPTKKAPGSSSAPARP